MRTESVIVRLLTRNLQAVLECTMNSTGRMCSVRLASAADCRSQVCDSNPFELIHDFQAVRQHFAGPIMRCCASKQLKQCWHGRRRHSGAERRQLGILQPCDIVHVPTPAVCRLSSANLKAGPVGAALVELVLPLPETARLQDVRRLSAEQLGAPPQGLRFWRWAQRMNGTYRPYASVADGVALSVGLHAWPGPARRPAK